MCTKSAMAPVPLGQKRKGYYRNYFLVPKKDKGICPILNLKHFNVNIRKVTLKMESLQSIITIMTPGLWLASMDLKNAYFHVAVNPAHRKFL